MTHHRTQFQANVSVLKCWTSSGPMGCGRSLWILRQELQYNCRALPWSFPAIWTESLVYWQNTGVGRPKWSNCCTVLTDPLLLLLSAERPCLRCIVPLTAVMTFNCMTSTWYGYQMSSLHVSSFLQLTSDSTPVSNQQSVASTEAARTKAFANKK